MKNRHVYLKSFRKNIRKKISRKKMMNNQKKKKESLSFIKMLNTVLFHYRNYSSVNFFPDIDLIFKLSLQKKW